LPRHHRCPLIGEPVPKWLPPPFLLRGSLLTIPWLCRCMLEPSRTSPSAAVLGELRLLLSPPPFSVSLCPRPYQADALCAHVALGELMLIGRSPSARSGRCGGVLHVGRPRPSQAKLARPPTLFKPGQFSVVLARPRGLI
jgi:hypothetical protein